MLIKLTLVRHSISDGADIAMKLSCLTGVMMDLSTKTGKPCFDQRRRISHGGGAGDMPLRTRLRPRTIVTQSNSFPSLRKEPDVLVLLFGLPIERPALA